MRWAAVVLVMAPQMGWAALKNASPMEVRAEVARLQGVVAGCAGAGGTACASGAVGDDLRVGDPKQGGYEVHWDWLRDALNKSKGLDAGKRGEMLRDSVERLRGMDGELGGAELGGAGVARQGEFARARGAADAVLAEAEFQRKTSVTWWDRVTGFFYGWLAKLLGGSRGAGAGRSVAGAGRDLGVVSFGSGGAGVLCAS